MEGRRRGVALAAVVLVGCALAGGTVGCGDDDSGAPASDGVRTANPERTFAPLVELARDERWRPMSARWFLERAVLWFAEDEGCEDRKIAVGRTLPEQQNPTIDWIFTKGLGSGPTYYRNPYDATCELDSDQAFYADQLTRPHDPGPRIDGARPGEGFYLDLVDAARGGPALGANVTVPVYVERTDEGDSAVRLTYWMLFGRHGEPGQPDAHEGDWERIDVLLRDVGEDRYEPVGVQVVEEGSAPEARAGTVAGLGGSRVRDIAWPATRKVTDTHPVVRLEPATHDATVTPPGEDCGECVPWQTWRSLADARAQLWYGFGGAWGESGETSATTGPLGPHRFFPSASEKQRELVAQASG